MLTKELHGKGKFKKIKMPVATTQKPASLCKCIVHVTHEKSGRASILWS